MKVILKSAHPEAYGDLEIECRELTREELTKYIEQTPETEKFVGTKTAPVAARKGTPGEEIVTKLTINYEGREYIMSEVKNTVQERTIADGSVQPDIVVTNTHSTSNEQYIVKYEKFLKMYTANADGTFTPNPDERPLTRVSENIAFTTSWGETVICLAGSYIVTYDAASNDYNSLEQGACESTYTQTPVAPGMKF